MNLSQVKNFNGLISCQRSINTEISRELLDTGHFEVMTVEADEDEHSIEMQLPYIAKVADYANLCSTMQWNVFSQVMESVRGKFNIVPVMVRNQT